MGGRRNGTGFVAAMATMATTVVMGLVAGCASGDDDDSRSDDGRGGEPSPTATPGFEAPSGWAIVDEASTVPPALDEVPVWGSDSTAPVVPQGVDRATFRGDDAVLEGTEGLSVVDAATGELRWSIPRAGPLPGGGGATMWRVNDLVGASSVPVVDLDGTWGVLVGYSSPSPDPSDTAELGVAALAGTDGRLLWKRPLVPSGPEPAGGDANSAIRTLLSDGRTAFAVAALPGPSQQVDGPEDLQSLELVALDGRTGAVRWERAGVELHGVADDVLTGFVSASDGPGGGRPTGVLVDKETGRPLPERFDAYAWTQPKGVAGHFGVVLAATDPSDAVGADVLVDLRTGAERGTLGRGAAVDCSSDGTLIACQVPDADTLVPHLAVYDSSSGTGTVAGKTLAGGSVIDDVWQGGVFVRTEESTDGGSVESALVDQAGNTVAELPGRFVAGSDRYVLMTNGPPDAPTYAIHQVTG